MAKANTPSRARHLLRYAAATALAAAVALTVLVPAAGAERPGGRPTAPPTFTPVTATGALTAQSRSCALNVLVQAFASLGDAADYTLVPGGGLTDMTGWTLAGGAGIVPGGAPSLGGDTSALSLPNGSSATTGAMCVTVDYPLLRFYARNAGASTSKLKVEVLLEDLRGNTQALPIATLTGSAAWQPTAPIRIWANLRALISSTKTAAIAFRFTPQGSGGQWQIDEIYVDPFKGFR